MLLVANQNPLKGDLIFRKDFVIQSHVKSIGFNQSNKVAFLCGSKYFWRHLQKRSSKNILWNSCITEINKLPVNVTTLKTNINLDVLDLIIIQSHLEGCFRESSCCSRKTNTNHSIHNYGPGWNEKINKTRK